MIRVVVPLVLLLASPAVAQVDITATISADHPPPRNAGTTITLTATSVSGGTAPYTYQWWLYDGATWAALSDWSTSASYAWTPATASSAYILGLWVRSAGTVVDANGYANLPFAIAASVGSQTSSTAFYSVAPPRVIDPDADCTGQYVELWSLTTADGSGEHDETVYTKPVPVGKAWIIRAAGLWGNGVGLRYAIELMHPVASSEDVCCWRPPLVGMTGPTVNTPWVALPPASKLVLIAGEYLAGRTAGMAIGKIFGIEALAWEVPDSCVGRIGMPW